MNGTLTVASEQGKGSTFTCRLPLMACTGTVIAPRTPVVGPLLIVHPEPFLRSTLLAFAADFGLEAEATGDPGVRPVRRPRIVLTDPAWLRHVPVGADVEIIAIADHAGAGSMQVHPLTRTAFLAALRKDAPPAALPGAQRPVFDATVLVVEDNPTNQHVVRLLLEKFGCRVEVASNGVEALERAAEMPFDLIFMDVQMPVMDGLEATLKLRERGVATPIVALTANAMEEDRERCRAAGMSTFVAKPIRRDDLLTTLKKHLAEVPVNRAPAPPMSA